MPRKKVQLKRIENRAAMQVTFSKRRKGLFKKAEELSIMCGAQVAVIVFSAASKLSQYGNPSVNEIIERWKTHQDTNYQALENPSLDLNVEKEIERLRKENGEKDLMISQMKGENLENLSREQLNLLAEWTLNGFSRLKAKLWEHYEKTIVELQHTIHDLMEENCRQNQAAGVENVVHQKSTSPKFVLTPNANCEDALHDLCLRL